MSSTQGGTNNVKDVIYIDVDDEITGVIDKVRGSGKKIVALVLPKRATVLQSIVNMKLLKRAADDAKKHLVLITSESGLMPLAGTVGVHVAKSLNSKPEIPTGPDHDTQDTEVEEVSDDADEESLDKSRTVGELSGTGSAEEDDTIELDDQEMSDTSEDTSDDKPKKGKNKKLKIPNFNKFRLSLVLGIAAIIALSGVSYAAFVIAPKATVTIKTDRTTVSIAAPITLKTTAGTALDAAQGIVPSVQQQVKKTLTGDAPATGQVNNGEKALGTVTMTAKNCSSLATPKDLPAGTGITTNGKTYTTQEKANFSGSGTFDGSCLNFKATNIAIKAQNGGASYDVASATFTVPGRTDVTATGSATGGTDDIQKIITQADVDAATQKIASQDTKPIQQELKNALIGRSLFPIESSFGVGTPETTLSAKVGETAENVTVTQTITYSMSGAKQDDLEKVVDVQAANKIDTKKQKILDYGLDNASFSVQSNGTDTMSLNLQTTVSTGAELNAANIKKQIAGKKAGDAQELIKANPGVTDVTVQYSPFWVSSIPKNVTKITVTIQESQAAARNADTKQ